MRLLFAFVLLVTTGSTLHAQQGPTLSPLTQLYLKKAAAMQAGYQRSYVYKTTASGQKRISALAKIANPAVGAALASLGVSIGTRAGAVWTLQIPLDNVQAVCALPGLRYLQLDEPVYTDMDSARVATRVDSVHLGAAPLAMPYFGDGVVMGIIDAGFDYGHPAFYDTSGHAYRVRRVWEQKTAGTPPAGYTYGRELTDSNAIRAALTDDNTISHGSHVAGIAAGSGVGGDTTGRLYRGMAPAADLVFVGINPDSANWTSTGMADIIDGAAYIFNYAASLGKPAMVNLSWGCSIGPHDGRSLFSEAMDALTGPGKLFACSAGNNGDQKLHLTRNFTQADSIVQTFVNFNGNLGRKETWVDIWGDSSKTFEARIYLYNGANRIDSTAWISTASPAAQTFYLITTAGDTCLVHAVSSPEEFNGKPRIFLNIEHKGTGSVSMAVGGTSGRIHAWNGFVEDKYGYYANFTKNSKPWAVAGDTALTISDMACTEGVLGVAAYTTKNSFTNISGAVQNYAGYATLHGIAPFSSIGMTTDGRVKPDIAAPGLVLSSAVSSYDAALLPGGGSYDNVVKKWTDGVGHDYYYANFMGTSMSSPAASGILALMLQMKPDLTPAQALEALKYTAIKDAFTGSIPAGDARWGWGKINAFGALQYLSWPATVATQTAHGPQVALWPNPTRAGFFVSYTSDRAGEAASFVLRNAAGAAVVQQVQTSAAGENIVRFDDAHLPAGIYFLTTATKNGTTTLRVVVPE